MEKQLLKKLLNYQFYILNKSKVLTSFFDKELLTLFSTIEQAHEQYKTTLDTTWVRQLLDVYHPTMSNAAKRNMAALLDDINHEPEPPDQLATDIIQDLFAKERARQIAAIAVDVINGKKTMAELQNSATLLLDNAAADKLQNYEEVEFNLDGLLEFTSPNNLYAFRHPILREKVVGGGPGNFCIIFGRPESGKSTLGIFEAAGYVRQGLRVGYFGNEEPAKRLYLRFISSALEKTEAEVRANPEACKTAFMDYSKHLRMMDCVGMDIQDVDAWCAKNKPDVLVLDQLDKFSIDGKFNRDDQRLGELYTYAREIAKRHKCFVIGVCQCSAEGEGILSLDFSMLAGSKTAKAGEADLIIGIGKHKLTEDDNPFRQFTISKNKINGFHGTIGATLDQHRVMYLS